jgi:hypothetical protein
LQKYFVCIQGVAKGTLATNQKVAGSSHAGRTTHSDAGDLRAALAGIRELVRITELLAKLTGQFYGNKPQDPGAINDNRRVTVYNFPVASPEMLAEVANARTIDLPAARPRGC